ncbi:MAG: hypothetical protein ACE5JO_10580 [Candidatus Binatia bacterium]
MDNLQKRGAVLITNGERLRVDAPKGVIPPDLRERLREHKAEIIALLSCEAEGDALERRFGHRAARLYPSLGKKVQTPKGEGRLWQVFTARVGVVLDDSPDRVTFLEPDEVLPLFP